jgi:hypothetical protein
MNQRSNTAPAGFSLVVSLIVLTLLAILVTGFLSSTAVDRATAHAFASKTQAETVAATGANQAISMLREYITKYPDSVTTWESLATTAAGPNPVEGTMLYYYNQTPPTNFDAGAAAAPVRYMLPLMSRGVDANGALLGPVLATTAGKTNALGSEAWLENSTVVGSTTVEANTIDLNRRRFNTDTEGWIGSAPKVANTPPKPYRARWIEVKSPTEKRTDASGHLTTTPKTTGRYAFWIEDESFKTNLNFVGRGLKAPSAGKPLGRGGEAAENLLLKTDFSASPTPAPLPQQIASLIPLQGILTSARAPVGIGYDKVASDLFTLRTNLAGTRLPDFRSYNQIQGSDGGAFRLADDTKFLTTVFSGGLNLSRHGSQRLNLNGLKFDKRYDDREGLTNAELQDGIDRVVSSIRYHTPKFGERMFRLTTGSTAAELNVESVKTRQSQRNINYSDIYAYKIAANIRDYIDPDPLPTVIMSGGTVASRAVPTQSLPSTEGTLSDLWALGKDSAPFLQEAVARYRSTYTASRYTLQVDYYIEFWNMTEQDVSVNDLKGDPFIEVFFQVGWIDQGTGGTLTSDSGKRPERTTDRARRRFVMHLSRAQKNGAPLVFKAKTCTVVTSDPSYQQTPAAVGDAAPFSGGYKVANIYYCPVDDPNSRDFRGPCSTSGIRPQFISQGGSSTPQDYETEIFMGNDTGLIESQPAPISHGGLEPLTATVQKENRKTAPIRDEWYGGTLLGNGTSPSQMGDPRTNTEALIFTRFNGGTAEPDQGRYFNDTSNTRFSLGLPNSMYVWPSLNNPWKDFYRGWDGKTNSVDFTPINFPAAAVVANAPMTSIGQLGDIFDPAREKGGVGSLDVEGARGGGRTLRIGQPDYRVEHDAQNRLVPNSPSQAWAAWRLCDHLSVTNELYLPGVININGLKRDNGAALRAACSGISIFEAARTNPVITSASTTRNQDVDLDTSESAAATSPSLNSLISQAMVRFSTDLGPFRERGEISELPLFNTGSAYLPGATGPQDMTLTFDRTREELVRRTIEMITTRGSVFSAYVVGQSISEGNNGKYAVTGTQQMKVTFQLIPKLKINRFNAAPSATLGEFQVPAEGFEPKNVNATDPKSVQSRFAKPDEYDIQILQVSY